jgi:hypothetical protein
MGEMTEQELIDGAHSELRALRAHLGLPETVSEAAYNALPYEERVTRAYVASIDLKLTMLDINRERRERDAVDVE